MFIEQNDFEYLSATLLLKQLCMLIFKKYVLPFLPESYEILSLVLISTLCSWEIFLEWI